MLTRLLNFDAFFQLLSRFVSGAEGVSMFFCTLFFEELNCVVFLFGSDISHVGGSSNLGFGAGVAQLAAEFASLLIFEHFEDVDPLLDARTGNVRMGTPFFQCLIFRVVPPDVEMERAFTGIVLATP